MKSNSRIMSPPKKIDEGMNDTLNWDEWYFVVSDEAEPEGGKGEAKEKGAEDEEMKAEGKGKAKEENEKDEEKEEEEEEEDEEEEDEELEQNLLIESETKMGSSSMDVKHNESRRFGISPLFKNQERKDIKVLVKTYVLPFLPAKSLVRFRAVSTEWDQWIQSPFLAHQQSYSFQQLSGYFYQQNQEKIEFLTMNRGAYGVPSPSISFLPESVTIKSSSNGLLLCHDQDGNNTYYICNPVNQEWRELPRPHYYHRPETAIVLAFEPSILNMGATYQVICPVTFVDQPIICFEVYSSATRSWTESTTICLELEAGSTLGENGFYIKGTAYWETSSRKVLAFNPKNAIHEIISLPYNCPHGVLTEMNAELCYIGISSIYGNGYFVEVYGGLYLNLKFRMKLHLHQTTLNQYRVLPCLNGNIVMILNGRAIHSYSLKDEKLEVIGWNAGLSGAAKYLPYVNSLVSVR